MLLGYNSKLTLTTRNIIMGVGGVLLMTALGSGFLFKSRRPALAAMFFPVFLLWALHGYAFKPPVTSDTVLYTESDYYTIKVKDTVGADGKKSCSAATTRWR